MHNADTGTGCHKFGVHRVLVGLLLLSFGVGAAAVPQLRTSDSLATAGFYQLSWDDGLQQVELQEAVSASFEDARQVYLGTDTASVFSGKPDGVWFYRLRTIGKDARTSDWSEPLRIEVAHHELRRALLVFATGLFVFLATVFMILRGTGKLR